jgi:transcriptional regulator with XRE-family HTH domain
MQHPKTTPSFAGQFLKYYRKSRNLSQEQFAYDLSIEPRALRAYENGERQLHNINELRRIADVLGIEPERLGIASSLFIPRTPEHIEEVITHVWSLVEESRLLEALTIIRRLTDNLQTHITTEDPKLLQSLARAHHAAGYVISEATRASESYEAILQYENMEAIARSLNDHTLLNIALTYQGDMYRRLRNLTKAITFLEAARDTTPQADTAAKGNGMQLLGRAYLRVVLAGDTERMKDFERAMTTAEELAYTFDPTTSSTQGHYGPGMVYEEYGRSYTDLGQTQKAMEYLERAQNELPSTKFWELLEMISRAILLIKDGELRIGVQLAIDAANQSRTAGIERFVERVYNIQQYLDEEEEYHLQKQREIRQIGVSLREALGKGNREI